MSTTILDRPEGLQCDEAGRLDAPGIVFAGRPGALTVVARVDDDEVEFDDEDDELEEDDVPELDDDFPKHGDDDDELDDDDLDDDDE